MPYLLTHYQEGDLHHCRLARETDHTLEHVCNALLTDGELAAFIEMVRKLDPCARVEQTTRWARGGR